MISFSVSQQDDQDDDDQDDQQKAATDIHFSRLLSSLPRIGNSILGRLTGRHLLFLPRDYDGGFQWLAKAAAERTWYNADWFIASYVAEVAPRLAADSVGMAPFFVDAGLGDDIALACYRHSLIVLGDMARQFADDEEGVGDEWAEALAEAIALGMLWD